MKLMISFHWKARGEHTLMKDNTDYNPELLRAIRKSNWRVGELAPLCRVAEIVFLRCLTGQTVISDALKERLSIVLDKPVEELWPE